MTHDLGGWNETHETVDWAVKFHTTWELDGVDDLQVHRASRIGFPRLVAGLVRRNPASPCIEVRYAYEAHPLEATAAIVAPGGRHRGDDASATLTEIVMDLAPPDSDVSATKVGARSCGVAPRAVLGAVASAIWAAGETQWMALLCVVPMCEQHVFLAVTFDRDPEDANPIRVAIDLLDALVSAMVQR